MKNDLFIEKGAHFSGCRNYRYKLWRIWDSTKPYCMFLMLNPSTADAFSDDRTVEKCQRYATAWGYGGLYVCNIFAFRTTDPDVMKTQADPVGPGNDEVIIEVAKKAGVVVCGWGNHGDHQKRSDQVRIMLRKNGIKAYCLKVTSHNEPWHPLYLKDDLKPKLYVNS